MRLFGWQCLVVNSMMVAALAASAETRPQYGGVLHVAMRAAVASLDPAELNSPGPDAAARRSLNMLMFDRLVWADQNGRVQPALAASWQTLPGGQHWQFRLRRGVKFHDGTPLTVEVAAASLRAANPAWNVVADAESIIIESDAPELLAELALPRNAIAKRNSDGRPIGTGPFHVVDWQPGKKLVLAAEDSYWGGRPFLDGIEIEMGTSFRNQITELELGKADLVEVSPDQLHRFSQEGRGLKSSNAIELLALVFTRDAASADEKLLRQALAWSVERGSIHDVLLQGAGQPTGGILPNWMSGYEFVFPVEADLARARQARKQVRTIPTWTVGYDASDPLARLLAERIALNARDAGLALQPTVAASADLRLVQISLGSTDPWIALAKVATLAGVPAGTSHRGSVQELYESELAILATERVIPLFHVPVSYASASTLKNWRLRRDGSWTVDDAWLGSGRRE